MKSILLIGMGRFGHHLCQDLAKLGNEIMIVDTNEDVLEDLLPIATNVRIGDCTNVEVLKSFGVGNFDVCIVCIGTNFQSSLEITSLLKELGAKYVISKANRDIHAKFLMRNGADEVIYPDRDIAERLATKVSANHVFDYIELTDGYSIYEIPPLTDWVGKSIKEADVRAKFHVSILGFKYGEQVKMLPTAEHIISAEEHLMVMGSKEDVDKILHKL